MAWNAGSQRADTGIQSAGAGGFVLSERRDLLLLMGPQRCLWRMLVLLCSVRKCSTRT